MFITKESLTKQPYGTHPRGYLHLRLYLARVRTRNIDLSFDYLTTGVVMNQTINALRHLRRLVRYSLSRHFRLHVTDQRVTHLILLFSELQRRQPRLEN